MSRKIVTGDERPNLFTRGYAHSSRYTVDGRYSKEKSR